MLPAPSQVAKALETESHLVFQPHLPLFLPGVLTLASTFVPPLGALLSPFSLFES